MFGHTRGPDPAGEWQRYVDGIEASNTGECHEVAKKTGHTVEEADGCDNGSVGCSDCPWKKVK